MSYKKNTPIEILKDVTLISLVILLCVLIKITWGYGVDFSAAPEKSILSTISNLFSNNNFQQRYDENISESMYPVKISIGANGKLYGIEYDSSLLFETYTSIKPFFEQAFAQNLSFIVISPKEFQEDLRYPIVFMEYEIPIPLPLFNIWLSGQSNFDDIAFSNIGIIKTFEGYSLFLKNRNYILSADITMDANLDSFISNVIPNDCTFAKNIENYSESVCPETLIFENSNPINVLSVKNPSFVRGKDSLKTLQEAFGYNPYTSRSYLKDNDATIVFVENFSTLTVNSEGQVIFSVKNLQGGIETVNVSPETKYNIYQIGLCKQILDKILQSIDQPSGFYMNDYRTDGKKTIISFDYSYGGIPVNTDNKPFAIFEFESDCLIYSNINIKVFEKTGHTVIPIAHKPSVWSLAPGANKKLGITYKSYSDDTLTPVRVSKD